MSKVYFYEVNQSDIIIVRKIINCGKSNIIFEDKKTEGLIFSFTLQENYSKKNIENFLKSKFNKIKLL